MKLKITFILLLVAFLSTFGQTKEWGTKFDYDFKSEIGPQLVLADNYNYFMLSIINRDGMQVNNQVIVRKFDQKNQLVETFTQNFPLKDMFTLHNYKGGYEVGTNKIVVFTESYSNKTKLASIHKIVFDKTTSQFETTLLVEYPIVSLSKSGNVFTFRSENNRFIGICIQKYNTKKEPELNECIVLNGTTLEKIWQKTIEFPLETNTTERLITNSGKIVFVRAAKITGNESLLAIADASTIENKSIGAAVKLQKPLAINIGEQDYLIAFNYPIKGIRRGDFGDILFYDITNGKILKNNTIEGFNSIKDIIDVNFRNIFIQNNEIHLFTETLFKAGTRPDPSMPGTSFTLPIYANGMSNLMVFSMEGELKKNIRLTTNNATPDLYHSYGMINIKGGYYINTGYLDGIYKLNAPDFNPNAKEYKLTLNVNQEDEEYRFGTFINQMIKYFPDSGKMLLAKSYSDSKLVFVTYTGFKP